MMKSQPSVSLIVTTYNWPDALRLSLLSIARQTILPKEVIVADDGSTDDTRQMIEEFQKNYPCPLIHVWQENKGFRAGHIRNKAIAKSSGEYIIQIDGDIILEKHFIQDHLSIAREGFCISGSRITLRKELSEKIMKNQIVTINLFWKGASHKLNGVRNCLLRKLFSLYYKKSYEFYGRGCNMSYWRKDVLAINGYDEDFTGWGAEDNELLVRLFHSGIKRQFLKFGGVQYHIYHTIRERNEFNYETLLKNSVESKSKYCENGLNKYL